MATTTLERTHPVTDAIVALRAQIAELADVPLYSMSPAEATTTLQELSRLTAALSELELRVVAHADTIDAGLEVAATSTASWWAHQSQQEFGTAARRIALGHALGQETHAPVRAALAAGAITEPAAHVIIGALDALPADLPDPTRAAAQALLIREAHVLGPRRLRTVGKGILAVVAPAIAAVHDDKALTAEHERAEAAMRLFMWDDGRGTTVGEFALPTLYAAMLKKMLIALAAPKHLRAEATKHATHNATPDTLETAEAADQAEHGGQVPPWRKPSPQRMGQALAELIERFAGGDLPEIGGTPATIVVTMTLDQLTGAPGATQLDSGETISAGQARRLACQAGIVPMVLGGDSVPLDVGRDRRFHDRHQRLAIHHRDRTCTTLGCDVPAIRCHVHHKHPWSHGGRTSVEDARLLCPRHHQYAHHPGYHATEHPDGHIEFHRRS